MKKSVQFYCLTVARVLLMDSPKENQLLFVPTLALELRQTYMGYRFGQLPIR